jgi:ribosomal protein L15
MVVNRGKKSAKNKGKMNRLGLRRRGSGNRGGFGRAGWGKRARQKAGMFSQDWASRDKKGTLKSKKPKNLKSVNLFDIKQSVELPNTRVLGKGTPPAKVVVKAQYFSNKAKEKIEKAGGKWEEI